MNEICPKIARRAVRVAPDDLLLLFGQASPERRDAFPFQPDPAVGNVNAGDPAC